MAFGQLVSLIYRICVDSQDLLSQQSIITIYIIIRDCTRVGAFPRAFCVPNSVALASLYPSGRVLGHSLVPIRITARVIPLQKKTVSLCIRTIMADCLRFHSLIARAAPHSRASAKRLDPAWSKCPLADRQGGATLARFGQTAGPSLIKFGTREGGEGSEGRGGEGRGGEGTVHTFHKPEPLWPRSLAGHPRSGWPASRLIIDTS